MTFDWSIKVTDLVIILATVAGPILAVWASDYRAQNKVARDRREWIFRTLMSTRNARADHSHVTAINHIEFAFPKREFPEIEDARSLYRKHLRKPDYMSEDAGIRKTWEIKANDLFATLLQSMGATLGLPFAKSDIEEESYIPDSHYLQELQRRQIQKFILEVLDSGRPINVRFHADADGA